MSLILDALRRAEAERDRQRGHPPGLHTHPSRQQGPFNQPKPRLHGWAWALLLAVAMLPGAVWLGAWLRPAQVPATAPQTLGLPTTVPSSPLQVPQAQVVATTPRARTQKAASPAATPPSEPLWLADLPASRQRELPHLSVSGSVYSEDRASRFLILNGEVVHEGARVAPGCVLEHIAPREMLLNCRGLRYRQAL